MLKYLYILKFVNHRNPQPEIQLSKTEAEWKEQLSPEVYQVARLTGAERAYSSRCHCKSKIPLSTHKEITDVGIDC